MNNTNITQIRLEKKDFKKLPPKNHYQLIYVDNDNFWNFTDEITFIINSIKEELPNWDQSPNYNDVLKRFKNKSHCLLFYYNEKCIGWNWGNENIAFNWKKNIQYLGKNEIYIGGCFVSRNVDRPADAGLYDYNMAFDYWINTMNYDRLYGYVDSWNRPSLRLTYLNGWKPYDYLKYDPNE